MHQTIQLNTKATMEVRRKGHTVWNVYQVNPDRKELGAQHRMVCLPGSREVLNWILSTTGRPGIKMRPIQKIT
jgi:hypothetical protein